MHYALGSLIGDIAHQLDGDPLKLSFIWPLRAARRSLAGCSAFPPERLAAVFAVFSQEVLSGFLPTRRQRSLPRQIKRTVTHWSVKRVPKPPPRKRHSP